MRITALFLLASAALAQNWTTYHGSYSSTHHSPLKQITTANAGIAGPEVGLAGAVARQVPSHAAGR